MALLDRVAKKWLPPEKVATLEWLASEYRLPEEGADLPGPYNPDYVPYLWGIFNALDDDNIPLLVMMKAAQVGWTFGLIGYLGARIDRQPSGMIIMFPKDGAAREFSDEKLVPAIKATPALKDKIDVSTSRSSGNRALFKKFPGGFAKLVGSNSISNVKSTPSPLVIVEEPDDTNESVGDQGDAIRLARERLKRFRRGKLVLGGTPSVDGISRVQEYIKLSDQRVLPVKCHDCGEFHVLDWENVTWHTADDGPVHAVYERADPDTAIYSCPHCGSVWDDWQRQQNVLQTCREARDAGDPFCGWTPTVETSGNIVGFKELSELYVCIPGTSLADVVRDYLEAEHDAATGDTSGQIVFQNSKLGRCYEYGKSTTDLDELESRAEDYEELTVPDGALILTAGVDVQHDRLAIIIDAWGPGEESWTIYWGEIAAKTSTTDINDPVWDELSKLLFTPRKHARGFMVGMSAVSIDSSDGTTSEAVYHWVRKHHSKPNVMAIKGDSHDYGTREIFSKPKQVDTKGKNNTKAAKRGLKIYMVGTYKAKDLLIGEKGRITLHGHANGRMHWYQNIRPDFYEQITAEIKAPSKKMRGKLTWQPRSGVRNEGLDCKVYALHAARALRLRTMTQEKWDQIENTLQQADLFSETETQPQSATQQKPGNGNVSGNSNKGWLDTGDGDWIK